MDSDSLPILDKRQELIILYIENDTNNHQLMISAIRLELTHFKISHSSFIDNYFFMNLESLLLQWSLYSKLDELYEIELYVSTKNITDNKKLNNLFNNLNTAVVPIDISHDCFETSCEAFYMILKQNQKHRRMSSIIAGMLNHLVQKHKLLDQPEFYQSFTLIEYKPTDFLKIDFSAINALSLLETGENKLTGYTVISYISQFFVTKMSYRMFKQWLLQPSKNIDEINFRQKIVKMYIDNFSMRNYIRTFLRTLPDLDKLMIKMSRAYNNMRHNISLAEGHKLYIVVYELLRLINKLGGIKLNEEETFIVNILNEISGDFENYAKLIESSVDMQRAEETGEFHVNPNYSQNLKEIDEKIKMIEKSINILGKEVGDQLNLDIKFMQTAKFGKIFEANKKKADEAFRKSYGRFKIVTIRKTTVTFTLPELNKYNEELEHLKEAYKVEQKRFVKEIIDTIVSYYPSFEAANFVFVEQDLLSGFAELYLNPRDDNVFCLPEFISSEPNYKYLEINSGWHMCIEKCINNTLVMDSDRYSTYVITGPNMGGKSTFIRQTAIATLLAHTGCPVPAQSCKLTVFDSIYTRVGASDAQLKGVSTFMNEMIDTANILSFADSRSLLIIDELGRGTSTYEGLGLSQSITEYINNTIGCFCLFATHFSELTELSGDNPNIGNLHLETIEDNGKLFFTFKVKPGAVAKSFGIDLIEHLKFPKEIVQEAQIISDKLTSRI